MLRIPYHHIITTEKQTKAQLWQEASALRKFQLERLRQESVVPFNAYSALEAELDALNAAQPADADTPKPSTSHHIIRVGGRRAAAPLL